MASRAMEQEFRNDIEKEDVFERVIKAESKEHLYQQLVTTCKQSDIQ
jgi:hypothetical protein